MNTWADSIRLVLFFSPGSQVSRLALNSLCSRGWPPAYCLCSVGDRSVSRAAHSVWILSVPARSITGLHCHALEPTGNGCSICLLYFDLVHFSSNAILNYMPFKFLYIFPQHISIANILTTLSFVFSYVFVRDRVSLSSRLAKNPPCSPDWSWMYSFPASAS